MLITQVLRNNTLAVAVALLIIGTAAVASTTGVYAGQDHVKLCPMPMCFVPTGCTSTPDDTLNDNGCLANPCGIIDCSDLFIQGCPLKTCIAPPDGCRYIPDTNLDDRGCPVNACGILDCSDAIIQGCPKATCPAASAGCTYVPDPNLDADGCPLNPCGLLTCQLDIPSILNKDNQNVQATSATSQASHTSRILGAVNQTNDPIHRFVNYLYRSSHLGQNPTFGQNRYWLSRITDKPTLGSLFGAMQWQAAHGLDNSL